jgi:hypothetical protein
MMAALRVAPAPTGAHLPTVASGATRRSWVPAAAGTTGFNA